jgi:hypothetical protein
MFLIRKKIKIFKKIHGKNKKLKNKKQKTKKIFNSYYFYVFYFSLTSLLIIKILQPKIKIIVK